MGRDKRRYDFSDLALRLALDLWGLEDLHFGWWDGLEPKEENLPAAQARYTEELLARIPGGVERVLDVGCGTGTIARTLVDRGYRVEGLAPDPELVERARARLADEARFHVSTFEAFESPDRFDLILMAESCQYVKSRRWLEQAVRLLRPGGWLLIADVFRHSPCPRDKPWISKAGHRIDRFLEHAAQLGFDLEIQEDITDQVGPTLELYDAFLRKRVIPVADAASEGLRRAHPILHRLLRFFFGRKAMHIRKKYLHQGLDSFRAYRAYLLLRFRKGGAPTD